MPGPCHLICSQSSSLHLASPHSQQLAALGVIGVSPSAPWHPFHRSPHLVNSTNLLVLTHRRSCAMRPPCTGSADNELNSNPSCPPCCFSVKSSNSWSYLIHPCPNSQRFLAPSHCLPNANSLPRGPLWILRTTKAIQVAALRVIEWDSGVWMSPEHYQFNLMLKFPFSHPSESIPYHHQQCF